MPACDTIGKNLLLARNDEHVDCKHDLEGCGDLAIDQPVCAFENPSGLGHRNDADEPGFSSVERRSIICVALAD